jgi:hypothetical protein
MRSGYCFRYYIYDLNTYRSQAFELHALFAVVFSNHGRKNLSEDLTAALAHVSTFFSGPNISLIPLYLNTKRYPSSSASVQAMQTNSAQDQNLNPGSSYQSPSWCNRLNTHFLSNLSTKQLRSASRIYCLHSADQKSHLSF